MDTLDKMENAEYLDLLVERYPLLESCIPAIYRAVVYMRNAFFNGGKLLICGNGGSASDSDHIVGELMKSFRRPRPLNEELRQRLIQLKRERGEFLADRLQQGLPAISLMAHNALISAVSNDIDGDLIFAQQVVGYGRPGDVLLAISTSGNSKNVYDAMLVAKAAGIITIAMTGIGGGKMKELADVLIEVPARETAFVQEYHLPVYHSLCILIEDYFFSSHKTSGNKVDSSMPGI